MSERGPRLTITIHGGPKSGKSRVAQAIANILQGYHAEVEIMDIDEPVSPFDLGKFAKIITGADILIKTSRTPFELEERD